MDTDWKNREVVRLTDNLLDSIDRDKQVIVIVADTAIEYSEVGNILVTGIEDYCGISSSRIGFNDYTTQISNQTTLEGNRGGIFAHHVNVIDYNNGGRYTVIKSCSGISYEDGEYLPMALTRIPNSRLMILNKDTDTMEDYVRFIKRAIRLYKNNKDIDKYVIHID